MKVYEKFILHFFMSSLQGKKMLKLYYFTKYSTFMIRNQIDVGL